MAYKQPTIILDAEGFVMKRVQAVIFDWAGTTVDYGSMAPVRAMMETFARHGIGLSDAEVRRDMGLFKKDHIRRILHGRTGQAPAEKEVEGLFADFVPIQMEMLEAHSELIAGTAELAGRLRGRGIRIGSTTGYTRPMLDLLLRRAAAQGYQPEAALCPDDVGGGRPHPWMCLRIALEFRLEAMASAVKVGDTASDIEEGLNAGMWTVGVSATGNDRAGVLQAAGAHYVIENVAGLEPVLKEIEGRLAS
jgi:phosphonoacetaldehyde hydrolase